ncbi:Sec-independent protein translocase subunit TatA/TatB [Methanimicrococcus blatticola]|uniref:Sec-independent protein translocase protein TatA n=1 Tax=Methanimicrococcus blatticola TaxID=91560 RepID=A0A484F6D2_9EURY|nr:twin-arginine translocase TatA/TatE family subunit [Methanimicrococcus blatticola]MBZ3934890.1 twin-arginine translocase TatA/TatE family subunit [Methanimicrococcus blatticola]MCC2509011.1 twin-arginine translocase TatA/TatE family subunit [Methanimicrococcus blatticola]TDQ70962.1 Sec-independent protein translocase TatA [Methanimicrococcus blatticola]
MWTPGTGEIILIVAVIVLLFGASKLPELARSAGKSAGEFKKAQKEAEISYQEFEKSLKDTTPEVKESKIQTMAKEQGIDTAGKTDDQLLDEISAKMNKEN